MKSEMDIAENLAEVKALIAKTAIQAGRSVDEITLIAVSKTHPASLVRAALAAGHRVFGENRVQEAEDKWPELKNDFPDVRLHLIGSLQSNKLHRALSLFDVIETLDRPKLARALATEAQRRGKGPDCFIQVNTGEEPQKAGIMPTEVDAFVKLCRDKYDLPLRGLMCIPPIDEEPALHFALLKGIGERNGLKQLSMGMSHDFDVAVQFDATLVRVGTAIFGERPAR